jgi:hypothetical protein
VTYNHQCDFAETISKVSGTMSPVTLEFLSEQIELSEHLQTGRPHMVHPQDLPGRYGRVIRAIDHLLQATHIEAVLGSGWAVWHHGFAERLTQDIDIALPATRIEEFLQAARVSGFEILSLPAGRWPKILHKETGIRVDLLPEGSRPGTASNSAPTTIPAPTAMGASGWLLRYMDLTSLIELKLAAGREKDKADDVMLIRVNPDQIASVRQHLKTVHGTYADTFDKLIQSAREQQDD